MSGDLEVRGAATAEELAAILAALRMRAVKEPPESRFEQWRRERIRALRDNLSEGASSGRQARGAD